MICMAHSVNHHRNANNILRTHFFWKQCNCHTLPDDLHKDYQDRISMSRQHRLGLHVHYLHVCRVSSCVWYIWSRCICGLLYAKSCRVFKPKPPRSNGLGFQHDHQLQVKVHIPWIFSPSGNTLNEIDLNWSMLILTLHFWAQVDLRGSTMTNSPRSWGHRRSYATAQGLVTPQCEVCCKTTVHSIGSSY